MANFGKIIRIARRVYKGNSTDKTHAIKEIIDSLYSERKTKKILSFASESLLFIDYACYSGGYGFFEDSTYLKKTMDVLKASIEFFKEDFYIPQKKKTAIIKPLNVVCICSGSERRELDNLGNFAVGVDRNLFKPTFMVTNQRSILDRRCDRGLMLQRAGGLCKQFEQFGVPVVFFSEAENILDLTVKMFNFLDRTAVDVVVLDGTFLNFPGLCAALSCEHIVTFNFTRQVAMSFENVIPLYGHFSGFSNVDYTIRFDESSGSRRDHNRNALEVDKFYTDGELNYKKMTYEMFCILEKMDKHLTECIEKKHTKFSGQPGVDDYPNTNSTAHEIRLIYFTDSKWAPIIHDISRDIVSELKSYGVKVFDIELSTIFRLRREKKEEELRSYQKKTIEKIVEFKPNVAMGYGVTGILCSGDSNILERLKIPYLSLLYDNPFNFYEYLDHFKDKSLVHIFGLDETFLPDLKEQGFVNSYYLPIGTSLYRNIHSFLEEKRKPEYPVAFVGSIPHDYSIDDLYSSQGTEGGCERHFLEYCKKCVLERNIYSQKKIFDMYFQEFPSGLATKNMRGKFQTVWSRIEIILSTLLRVRVVKEIGDLGISLYGNEKWKGITKGTKIDFKNGISYQGGLAWLYKNSKIIINRSPLTLQDAVQQRCLDVGAVGGFILTDYQPVLEKHFSIGEEIAVYYNFDDLREKVKYYLKNEEKREKIAQALNRRVLKEHTWSSRVKFLLDYIQNSIL